MNDLVEVFSRTAKKQPADLISEKKAFLMHSYVQ